MTPQDVFRVKAPAAMRTLMHEFLLDDLSAAAIVGNGGYESLGFTKLQEMKPTVKGSRGGYGGWMWTGARRKAFEAWCLENRLQPDSDQAQIGFLIHELYGPEKKAIPAVKKAVGLEKKVIAFEAAYERAGVKRYPKRLEWAQLALDAYRESEKAAAAAPKPVPPPAPAPAPKPAPAPQPVPTPSPAQPAPLPMPPLPRKKPTLAQAMVGVVIFIFMAFAAYLGFGGH